jgi:hypothetical protein
MNDSTSIADGGNAGKRVYVEAAGEWPGWANDVFSCRPTAPAPSPEFQSEIFGLTGASDNDISLNHREGSRYAGSHAIFGELKQIAAAALQVVHTGSPTQIAEAQKILNQARRTLYRLLAEDASEDDE